jgi:hypothetical protein
MSKIVNTIESFKDFNNNDETLIEGINLRAISAVALASKSSALSKNIQSIKLDNDELDKKLNLISKQLLYSALLTAQLGLMNKKRR